MLALIYTMNALFDLHFIIPGSQCFREAWDLLVVPPKRSFIASQESHLSFWQAV